MTNFTLTETLSFIASKEGSFKHLAAKALLENLNEPLPLEVLTMATYGTANEPDLVAIGMVLKGVKKAIEDNGFPFQITREKRTITLTGPALLTIETAPAPKKTAAKKASAKKAAAK